MIRGILGVVTLVGLLLVMNEQPDGEVQKWWINVIGLFLFGGGAGILIAMDIEE